MPRRTLPALTVVAGGSGRDPHTPSDDTRRVVVLSMLNGLTVERTAAILGLTRTELERHYRDEIDNGADLALIEASNNMLWLAAQRFDLGVSLRANTALLAPRLKAWREPAAEPATSTAAIDDMDLETINREIERLQRDMAASRSSPKEDLS